MSCSPQTPTGFVTDSRVRRALREDLLETLAEPGSCFVDELALPHGAGRADVAVLGARFHGFEIKGERDTLRRLASQVAVYDSVFDFVTIVTADKHLPDVLKIVPQWWGVEVAEPLSGGMFFRPIRPHSANPCVCTAALAQLLHRDSASRLAESIGMTSARTRTRRELHVFLGENASASALRGAVKSQFRVTR